MIADAAQDEPVQDKVDAAQAEEDAEKAAADAEAAIADDADAIVEAEVIPAPAEDEKA